jgi:hypothetical protein
MYTPQNSPIEADPALRAYLDRELHAIAREIKRPIERTPAETAAEVVPKDLLRIPGDLRRYGGVPDASDSAEALAAAVAQAQQTGGAPVYVSAGDNPLTGSTFYRISAGVEVDVPIIVYGDNYWRSVLSATADITMFTFNSGAARSVVRDLGIWGNSAVTTKPGIKYIDSAKNLLQSVYISRFYIGVQYTPGVVGPNLSSYLCSIRDSWIVFNLSIDIEGQINTNALHLSNVTIGNGSPKGLVLTDSNSLTIMGGDCEFCTTRAIDIVATLGLTQNVGACIHGMHFENNNSDNGDIWLHGTGAGSRVTGVSVQGCLFLPNTDGIGNYAPLTVDEADGVAFIANCVYPGYDNTAPVVDSGAANYVQLGNSPSSITNIT